jgi:drug/metabolite transporter (DMT)-like permease
MLSWLVIGETPERATLVGGPLAVLAVYLINRGGLAGGGAAGAAGAPGAAKKADTEAQAALE